MGSQYSWPDPTLGSCYNPNLLFSGRMTQGLGSITVHLTPRWGCVTTWICKYWWGPNIVDLTPSWGPVTTQIYFSLEEWPKDFAQYQFIWPQVGVLLGTQGFDSIEAQLTPRLDYIVDSCHTTPSWGCWFACLLAYSRETKLSCPIPAEGKFALWV